MVEGGRNLTMFLNYFDLFIIRNAKFDKIVFLSPLMNSIGYICPPKSVITSFSLVIFHLLRYKMKHYGKSKGNCTKNPS